MFTNLPAGIEIVGITNKNNIYINVYTQSTINQINLTKYLQQNTYTIIHHEKICIYKLPKRRFLIVLPIKKDKIHTLLIILNLENLELMIYNEFNDEYVLNPHPQYNGKFIMIHNKKQYYLNINNAELFYLGNRSITFDSKYDIIYDISNKEYKNLDDDIWNKCNVQFTYSTIINNRLQSYKSAINDNLILYNMINSQHMNKQYKCSKLMQLYSHNYKSIVATSNSTYLIIDEPRYNEFIIEEHKLDMNIIDIDDYGILCKTNDITIYIADNKEYALAKFICVSMTSELKYISYITDIKQILNNYILSVLANIVCSYIDS